MPSRVIGSFNDFVIYVPPFVPHQEINALADEPLACVIERSDQEPIVVNLDDARCDCSQNRARDLPQFGHGDALRGAAAPVRTAW